MENINHRNYFLNKSKEVVLDKADVTSEAVIVPQEPINPYTEGYLYNLNKDEQIEILLNLGISMKDIKKLKYEKDRVEMVLRLLE